MDIGNYGLFSWQTLLTKAGVNATVVAVIVAVVQYIAHGRATNDWTVTPDLQSLINMGVAAGMAALWAAGKNWAKNHQSSPLSKFFVLALVAAVAMSGCASTGLPASLGKPTEHHTRIKTQQPPTTDDKGNVIPGESYEYEKSFKAAAGVQAEGTDNLDIGIDADGSWHIRQGNSGKLDTSGQAAGIKDYATIQAAVSQQFITAFQMGMQVAGQLVGVKLTNDANADQLNAANRAAIQQMAGEITKEIIKAQKPKTPKPEVTPEPVVVPSPVVTLPGN